MNFIKSKIMNIMYKNNDKIEKYCDNERFEYLHELLKDISETIIFLLCVLGVLFLVVLGITYILYLGA